MPRLNLIRSAVLPYHVYNRVNNREWFHLPVVEVWRIFTDECRRVISIADVRIHSFVLMSNHFHMILTCSGADLGEVMREFSGSVTRTYNEESGRIGHLFAGRYKWSLIGTPLYYAHALKYVYRNPVRARICEKVEQYPFSTVQGLAGLATLPFEVFETPSQFRNSLVPEDPGNLLEWLNRPLPAEESKQIRRALRRRVFELPNDRATRASSVLEVELR